ncbi:MAG: hypothetical protein ACJ75R_08630 [Solirubrobacterales bacterium]
MIAAVGCLAAGAVAKPKPPHHHKPPRPKVELLTGTEQGVLRREQVKVGVQSKRGDEARVKARFVVDGYPDDFIFRLGPESAKLGDDGAGVAKLGLSPRQREVLDFAIKSCHGATLSISATVNNRTGHANGSLRMPSGCSG